MTRSSQAATAIDRRDSYYTRIEVRQRPDFNRQWLRGIALQDEMRRRWAKPVPMTNPDVATENRA